MDSSNLVCADIESGTIKIRCALIPASKSIKSSSFEQKIILDTGASTTSFAEEVLVRHGYGQYTKSRAQKLTATGPTEFWHCQIQGLKIANQFTFPEMKVDVLKGWGNRAVVGVLGMDILSQMTFILSHEYKKFILTDKSLPTLMPLFGRSNLFS